MRKAILTGLLAGVCAASAGKVNSGVDARVQNLCVFQASGQDVASTNVTGNAINLGHYRANQGIASVTTTISTVQCNRGTALVTSSLPGPVLLNRQEGSGSPLKVLVQFGSDVIGGNGNNGNGNGNGNGKGNGNGNGNNPNAPTVYNVRATVQAEAGQWGVQGGTYQGTATVTLTYN